MCLTNHKLQNIPPVSCCLHLWSSLDCFFVNTCTFSAYLLHLITYRINRCRCKNKNENTNLFLKKLYYEISCYNLPLMTLFVQNTWAVTAQDSREKTNKQKTSVTGVPCAIHKNLLTKKKTNCCVWDWLCTIFCLSDNKCFPASCHTYFLYNLGQRAFAV